MNDLFQAIYAKFTGSESSTGADDLYDNLTGSLHNTEAPQNAEYPYAVFFLISDVPHWTFDATMENVLVQFSIYDEGSNVGNIGDLYGYLTSLYDWCTLDLDDYHSVYMKREFSELSKSEGIWQYVCQYRIEIQKK
jgi:hypothetical protein